MDDDFELEVSDLRTGRPVEAAPAPAGDPVTGAGGGAPPAGCPALATTSRRAALGGTLRAKRVRAMFVIGLALLVGVGAVLSVPATRDGIRAVLGGPTPTLARTAVYGSDLVYVTNAVPWGLLTIDGRQRGAVEIYGAALQLGSGRHTIAFRADPFPELRCTLTVPAAPSDTCPVEQQTATGPYMGERVLDLGLAPQKLPPDQYGALVQAAAQAVQAYAPTTAVDAGDHYRDAAGRAAVASEPLTGTLVLALNSDPGRQVPDTTWSSCVTLCAFVDINPSTWLVGAHVSARWQFTGADGRTVAAPADTSPDVIVPLDVAWQNGWVVRPYWQPTGVDFCSAMVSPGAAGSPLREALTGADGGVSELPGPSLVEGCAVVIASSAGDGQGAVPAAAPATSQAEAQVYLYRCGVLLAASDAAHRTLPGVPVASAHERALAQQWLQHP